MVAHSAWACLITYFIISAGGYNDDFHNTALKFQFIYDTDSIFQKFNFKQSGQIGSFISQRCAVASVFPGNRIFSDLLNALDDRLSDGIVQRSQVIQGFRQIFKFSDHSISGSSTSSRSASEMPKCFITSAAGIADFPSFAARRCLASMSRL